jgi:Tfp pilus assembly protein PilV
MRSIPSIHFHTPSNSIKAAAARGRRCGMSLVEVMIAMALAILMTASAVQLSHILSRWSMNSTYHSEAHKLLQDKLDELMACPWANFVASDPEEPELITSTVRTTFAANRAVSLETADPLLSPVVYTRWVEADVDTPDLRTLRVHITWSWLNRDYAITNYTITRTRET